MGVVIVIDHGNFHMEDNDFKYTSSWELTDFSKSAESQLNRSVHFISSRSFKNRTNSKRSQNFRSIAILQVILAEL